MEQNIPTLQGQQQNKFLAFIQGNQKIVLLGGGAIVFFIILIVAISMTNTNPTPTVQKPTPTIRQAQTNEQIQSPTKAPEPIRPISPEENKVIINDVDPQIQERVSVTYSISPIKAYGKEWAMFEITNPSTDPAKVIAKKEQGSWVVKLGPGTSFEESELRKIGAPENLINEVNKPL